MEKTTLSKYIMTQIAKYPVVLVVLFMVLCVGIYATTQSLPVSHILSEARTEKQHIHWTTTGTEYVITYMHKYWGPPIRVYAAWTTAAPFADQETCYVIASDYESTSLSAGQQTVYRDEGITSNPISGAECDLIIEWPNR
jgi:hypothetical protein